jgi:predicted permease
MRHAFKAVFKSPGFSLIAIATLAVGIGLNVALFGIFNALLFRPLAVSNPAGLVAIRSASVKPDGPRGNLTYPDFEDLRARRDVLVDAFAFTQITAGLSVGGRATRVNGQIVTSNMFDVLGVRAALGRTFSAQEDREQVAVVSDGAWRAIFGGDAAVVGSAVTINGRSFTVIGVAPRGFRGPDRFEPVDLWVPLGTHPAVLPGEGTVLSREHWWLTGIGRLAPGVDPRTAQSVLEGVARGIAAALPSSHDGFTVRVSRYHGTPDDTRGEVVPIAALVMTVTFCVLLIACANVAGLLVSRAAARQREIAIRLAIGATRAALTRQLLAESLVLAAFAGTAGLIISMWGTEAIVRFAAIPAAVESTPDWRVLLFTAAASLVAGIAFGLAPALRAASLPLIASLRSEPGADARPRSSRLQRGLVVGQLAMSLIMLASAGMLLRGLSAAWRTNIGFEYENRVAVSMDLRLQNYDAGRTASFLERARAGVRALPGIENVTYSHLVPFGGRVFVYGVSLPGQAPDADPRQNRVSVNEVGPDFFVSMGIRMARGRTFMPADFDRGGPPVAIISEAMASRFWNDRDPIGQRFSIDGAAGPWRTVVGVAGDVQIDEFTERPWPAAWVPFRPDPGELVLMAASPRPPAQVLREIENVLRGIDADLPLYASRPVRDYVAERLDGERALSKLLTICGALALGLAGLGLYGVTAYGVARRTREIGVRMALGADRTDVLRLFVTEGLRLATRGVIWGILPAIAATYALSGMFVGVFPIDPLTLFGATATLIAATLLAAYVPARRATRVDPLIALRTE